MRDHSKHVQFSRQDCIAKLVETSSFSPKAETVGLHEALGRVTACECVSKTDVPNALCARLDGIAVRFDDFADGMPDTAGWQLGREFDWANTGTAMPKGFDTEIAIEQVEVEDGGKVEIHEAPREKGQLTKPAGSDFKRGETVVAARTRLTPARIAALATCGHTEVEVLAKPRVVFIPTGDELVAMGTPLAEGKTYETNGILLEGKLRLWGAEPIVYPCLPDDWDEIRAALLKAAGEADIVCINAGSSKGSKDFTMEILEEIGTVYCHETNHGPGHHTSASSIDGVPVLGLSGPPTGCEITADWYLKPLVDSYLFGAPREFSKVKARVSEEMVKSLKRPGGPHGSAGKGAGARGGRAEKGEEGREGKTAGGAKPGNAGPGKGGDFFGIKPVHVEFDGEGYTVWPVGGGKHLSLSQADEANAYLTMARSETAKLAAGDTVQVELRYPYTRM